jgi:hypothetical protein
MLKQARFNSLRSRLDSKDTLPPKMEWTILVGLTFGDEDFYPVRHHRCHHRYAAVHRQWLLEHHR